MARIFVNVARDGSSRIAQVKELECTGIRIVLTPENNLEAYFKVAMNHGLSVIGVIARESFGGKESPDEMDRQLKEYNDRYGQYLFAVQSGNEPDINSESSWTMLPHKFVDLGRRVRRAFSLSIPIITGGLASGHPDYISTMDLSWAHAVAIHAYLKDAPNPGDLEDLTDIIDLIDQYKQVTDLPIQITEWGWWGANEDKRAQEEVTEMVGWAAGTRLVDLFCYFCLSDQMVHPFGLYNIHHAMKHRALFFASEAKNAIDTGWGTRQPSPAPEPTKPVPGPTLYITPEQIIQACEVPEPYKKNVLPAMFKLAEQMQHAGINDKATQIGMAATVAIETGNRWLPISEFRNADGSIPSYWYGYDGGWIYHGRGYIQNTHKYNYAALGPKIAKLWDTSPDQPDFDFVTFPEKLLEPDMSAAAAAVFFRDNGLWALCNARDWVGVRRAVQGQAAPPDSIALLTKYATALVALTTPNAPPLPRPVRVTYRKDEPVHPQEETFDCSQESAEWALYALGRAPADDWLEGTMFAEGVMSRDQGLMDATGAQLAAFIAKHYGDQGIKANNEANIFWEWIKNEGAKNQDGSGHGYPVLIGGRAWNHWSAVRDYDPVSELLFLANPANGHKGVFQTMNRQQFDRLGPFSAVRIWHDDLLSVTPAPVLPPPSTDRTAELVHALKTVRDICIQYVGEK